MAIDVTATIQIHRPVDDVASYVIDSANDLSWIRALTSSDLLTGYPIGQGTRVRRVAKMMRRSMPYTTEIVEFAPRELVMHTVDGPFPMIVSYRFEEAEGGTRVSVRNQGGKGLMFRLFSWLIGRMVNGRVQGDLHQLKQVLESSA
jgi:hypothetical protein